ncbi:MAG TPA: hypothetical protein VHW23_29950 [Kofleriaceae bacterium]|nr:hypothetical protein [Kofleriaceae bacterium]
MRRWPRVALLVALCALAAAPSLQADPPGRPRVAPPKPPHDGVHDFDYAFGAWKEHTTRLKGPLTGSTTWFESDGVSVIHPLLGGRAHLVEYEGDGPSGHRSLLSIRTYDPQAHQWSMNFSTPERGALWPTPMVGEFQDGHGELYSIDDINGRMILVRFTMTPISATSHRSEQAFSADGGRTWETNWINVYTRMSDAEAARVIAERRAARAAAAAGRASIEGQHDFDFDVGRWKTHITRRQKPLTGSNTWVDYDGTRVVHSLWDGRASLVEVDAAGPAGRIQGIGLRLFDPRSRQWSLNWASVAAPTMGVPTIGGFHGKRGEFFDQEPFDGRAILARNLWFDVSSEATRFEQAFSADGGASWEANWIATDTRTAPASDGW